MNIAVDLDDVLGDTMPRIMEFHNATYGTRCGIDDVTTFDLWNVWHCTRDEAIERIRLFHKSPFDARIRPIRDAQAACRALAKRNKLFVVTSRRNIFAERTRAWIAKYFPDMFTDIRFTNHYSPEGNTATKAAVCDAIGADVFIEDNPAFATEAIRPDRRVFLFDHPWNAAAPLPAGIVRVTSWEEILERLHA